MIVEHNGKEYDCYWGRYGWSYTAIYICRPGRWWLTRKLGLGTLAVVPCTRAYGFSSTMFQSAFEPMVSDEFRKVCLTALRHYQKTLDALETYR